MSSSVQINMRRRATTGAGFSLTNWRTRSSSETRAAHRRPQTRTGFLNRARMPPGVRSSTDGVCPETFRPVALVYHVRQLPRRPAESAFSADRRMRTWRRYAGSEAQKDAARIRKSGKLSSEHRQEINAKLAFFEGEAKDVYIREITPALSVAEQAERREREANARICHVDAAGRSGPPGS